MKQNICLPEIEAYSEYYTAPESRPLVALVEATENLTGKHMLSGRAVGRLLQFLIQLMQAKVVVDIGTYTGYSAISMAESLPPEGKVITLESSQESYEFAKMHFASSPHGHKIKALLGSALVSLEQLQETVDLVFIDADKANTELYYEVCLSKLKTGGLIIVDDVLWYGEVLDPPSKQAKFMHAFNQKILADPRVENVILTVRHGLNVIRKL